VSTPLSNHYIINGFDGLAYRLAEQLAGRYGAAVAVLMTPEQRPAARDFASLTGVRVFESERVDEAALRAAGLAEASGFALTAQDDVGNIHLALLAQEIAPALRLVIRMYNTGLGENLETLLGNSRVLSDAEIAAPALVATALGEVTSVPVRIGRRVLIAAGRSEVAPRDIVCGLAIGDADDPVMLPGDDTLADVVLAEERGTGSNLESTLSLSNLIPAGRPSLLRQAATLIQAMLSRKTRIAVTVVLGVILAAGAGLGMSLGLPPWRAIYLAATTVLAGPQANDDYSPGQQTLQLVLGLAGLAFIPLVTALVVEGIVKARLAVARVRLNQHRSGHVIVAGLGGVGTRVMRLLHSRGVNVVAIALDDQARGIPVARELNIPLIIGEPEESTLRQAGVQGCRALMAVASSDVSNLQTALHGRNLSERLHVVLRLFDGDLAARVRRAFSLPLSRSVSYVAAPAFAEALMEREVIGTIPVGRRVLLVADVFVSPGSTLDGAAIATVDEPGLARVIAVTEFGEPRPLWKPGLSRRVQARDKLTVIATRDGLSRLTQQAGPGGRSEVAAG
jgi:Trk K+ transport system NAD-binding subunit